MKHGLVIELDGGQHNFDDHRACDVRRDGHLAGGGFRVLRFWNSDVDRNLEGVLQSIDTVLREGDPHPAAFGGHPPPAGEG
jgi:very-short-patch-repair endonuclease